MWLSAKFVPCGRKVPVSNEPLAHYQWLRVISCTFKCRLLLCSAQPNIYLFFETETLQRQQTTTHISFASLCRYSHGQFARTAERSAHLCDACKLTLTTAREVSPENSACSVYHTDTVLLECFIAHLMTNILDWYFFHFADRFCFAFRFGLVLFCFCMCAFVKKCLLAFIPQLILQFRLSN